MPRTKKKTYKYGHPLVKEMHEAVLKSPLCVIEITRMAGVTQNAIWDWCRGCQPTLANFNHVLNVLGYELKIVEKEIK